MPEERTTKHTVLRAEGFSCPSCVAKVEHHVRNLPGVSGVKVHFASARIEVDHDPEAASVEQLIAGVRRAGFRSKASAF